VLEATFKCNERVGRNALVNEQIDRAHVRKYKETVPAKAE